MSGRKNYFLDSGVLLQSPESILSFDEHNVFVCDITLELLDRYRNNPGEEGANARAAVRIIEGLRSRGSLLQGVPLDSGGIFRIMPYSAAVRLPDGWDEQENANRILRTCKTLCMSDRETQAAQTILVSNNSITRLKAELLQVPAEDYRTTSVAVGADRQYRGRRVMKVPGCVVDGVYRNEDVGLPADACPVTNEFFVLIDEGNPQHAALARWDGSRLVRLREEGRTPFGVLPRNAGQRFAFEALLTGAEQAPLVILKGGAGTAKTFCALAAGLEQVLEKQGDGQSYRRVLVARPNIKFDDDIGFLKGSEREKIDPLIRPVKDNLEALMDQKGEKHWGYLFDRELLAAEALAYFRGRSITNTFIIIDEAQNMTPNQAFGIITRAGVGSKIALLGDPEQIDNPSLDSRNNGLSFASERMKGNPLCWQVSFEDHECTRSSLAKAAIALLPKQGMK